MATTPMRMSLVSLLTEVHRLATGQPLTVDEALEYFRNPKRLAAVVERSGLLHDPQRRLRLEHLIATKEDRSQRELTDGI